MQGRTLLVPQTKIDLRSCNCIGLSFSCEPAEIQPRLPPLWRPGPIQPGGEEPGGGLGRRGGGGGGDWTRREPSCNWGPRCRGRSFYIHPASDSSIFIVHSFCQQCQKMVETATMVPGQRNPPGPYHVPIVGKT